MKPSPYFPCFLFGILSIFTTTLISSTSSARILSVTFFSTKSHKITYDRLLEELAARGHQLTVLTPFPSSKVIKNLHEIKVMDMMEMLEDIPNRFDVKESTNKAFSGFFKVINFVNDFCVRSQQIPEVQALLGQKFDLILWLGILNECSAGFVHKMNTSTILISPVSLPSWQTTVLGSPNPTSFVPNLYSSFGDHMSFKQRALNFIVTLLVDFCMDYVMAPGLESAYREGLNDSTLPNSREILKNVSLVLSNSHISLNNARPFLPDVVEVGGMHCRPAVPLPKELEEFVNSSLPHGFIYFSMGTLPGDQMHDKERKILLTAFSRLKQKVLWKWETEKMDDLPPNVKLTKWASQQDILGHPKLRAFITHGGLGSITEAVYHGAPLVGMPLASDQYLNMEKAVEQDFAIQLDFSKLTAEELVGAVHQIMDDPKYKTNIMKLSKIFTDQMNNPLDRAVFWTEYVIRHQGAVHLRSASRDLNLIQYHSIDVVVTLITLLLVIMYIIFSIVRFTCRKISGRCFNRRADTSEKSANQIKKKN